jgi:hypothetical protein
MKAFTARSPVNFLLLFAILQAPSAALADQDHVQFCWAVGQFDRTIYFAEVENREDRQNSFEQLLEVSGIDHLPVQCRVSDISSHRLMRTQLMRDWLKSELETVNTTFLSDLDY